ncbi:MAG: helix-turn-helix domain-containing protein [Lachnospiraceae bacterium]|nr:helix-turn-helix domain-containing protein [Lachnospiraceae bacterium]
MYKKYLELLAETNKTSYQVSQETGISQTAFSNWKNRGTKPSLESLHKLSKYFGVSIEYFLEDES